MQFCGYGNADRINIREKVAIIFKKADTVLTRRVQTALDIDVCHTHHFNVFQKTQNAGMMLSHIANADDANPNWLRQAALQMGLWMSLALAILHSYLLLHHGN
jgi:hypothetical protein